MNKDLDILLEKVEERKRILEKIHNEGLNALTLEEKRFLYPKNCKNCAYACPKYCSYVKYLGHSIPIAHGGEKDEYSCQCKSSKIFGKEIENPRKNICECFKNEMLYPKDEK